LPVHGDRRELLHAGLEIRQDQIGERSGQAAWAAWLELLFERVLERFPEYRRQP
jgi:predicted N-formylglutamate amidohydrolase